MDCGGGEHDHEAVEDRHAADHEEWKEEDRHRMRRLREAGDRPGKEPDADEAIGEGREVDPVHREEELGIERLDEDPVEPAGADHLRQLLGARHEERLDDRVDDHAGGDEGEERLLRPARPQADLGGESEDEEVEGEIHRHPAEARDALEDEVRPERHVADETGPREGEEDREVAGHQSAP